MNTQQRQTPNYPCPKCGGTSIVKDSRPAGLGGASAVRRRRLCLACKHRWTTWETGIGGGRLEQHMGSAARAVGAAIVALQNLREEIVQITAPDPDDERQAPY
jgi:hypothetical protein